MRKTLFPLWCLTVLCVFAAASWYGYSPFGDGKQERNAYSRGGGPTHK
jgi:hypothetical protein